jgi:hypothetical protein
MTIGTNNFVGIGTASPAYRLDVIAGTGNGFTACNALRLWTQVTDNNTSDALVLSEDGGAATGRQAIAWRSEIAGGTYVKARIWSVVGPGFSASMLGFDVADPSRVAQTRMVINTSGNVGIGTTAPTHPLHVATNVNNVSIQANSDIVAFSDARVKTDLAPITDALTKISSITGYTYLRLDQESTTNKRLAGVVAQEVKEVLPEVVHEDADGMMSVAYGNMSALLIEAIKELKHENAALKRDNIALKHELESIKTFIGMS